MDDLAGLDWNASANNKKPQPVQTPSYPSLRPSPAPQLSGRSTPLSGQSTGAFASLKPASSKPSTPANDSFANLLGSNAAKSTSTLTLAERQRQLLEEKTRQQAEQRRQFDSHFGVSKLQEWDALGSGRPSPAPGSNNPFSAPNARSPGSQSLSQAINKPFASLNGQNNLSAKHEESEEDILAAFNSAAPVDASSHFPPPSQSPAATLPLTPSNGTSNGVGGGFDDDDDPFGLGQLSSRPAPVPPPSQPTQDNDDILGMLSRPENEFSRPRTRNPEAEPPTRDREAASEKPKSRPDDHPQAKAVAELVDMGFSADRSQGALAQTTTGLDIQAAVGILLNQAHEEAKQKVHGNRPSESRNKSPLAAPNDQAGQRERRRERPVETDGQDAAPAWMRASSAQRKSDNQSPAGEKDVSQYASEIGSTLFKSANSLWKQGQKKVQRAVADLQQDANPNQPKWMKDAALQDEAETPRRRQDHESGADSSTRSRKQAVPSQPQVTDEALMLESGDARPQARQKQERTHSPAVAGSALNDRRPSPALEAQRERSSPQPRFAQQVPQRPLDRRPAARLTREAVEEQSAQAYISPARRKKATPKPEQDDELLSDGFRTSSQASNSGLASPPLQLNNPFLAKSPAPSTKPSTPQPVAKSSTPIPVRPKAPPRSIPATDPSALRTSAAYRQKGTEAFKRGDYPAAHDAYTAALAPLPSSHPVTIVILCNRALVNIKVGEPKAAVSDAEAALKLIGPAKGESEVIALGEVEGRKDMKEFYGKALMRKAEALENMEKWMDAAAVWREAVTAGVGGQVAMKGRERCEKASGTSSAAAAPPRPKPVAPKKPVQPIRSAMDDLAGRPTASQDAKSTEAVAKLRAANEAAERADDEKFALADTVDSKLVDWKGTKADNLRALLGSLDKVLWSEAGWKKVGMQDLVMPNKVKIIYMKAIAKVHPDKIAQDATTEQRMISAAVFSTLNEAWDKFKKDNNL